MLLLRDLHLYRDGSHRGCEPAGSQGGQAEGWRQLLGAGINDWGGLSPLTRDFVNPEKPWPHLKALADATAATGEMPHTQVSQFT